MSIEVRRVRTDEEWDQHAYISAYSFDGDRGEEGLRRRSLYYDRSWALAAFDSGEMVAGLTVIPFEQYMGGTEIKLGGIASVSCLPERRRGGYVGRLLTAALEQMRDSGQVLSGLFTPHYSLYRKFGWELAGRTMTYAFEPKAVRVRHRAEPGEWRRVAEDAWPELDRLFRAQWFTRNGAVARSERRWRYNLLRDYAGDARDVAVWSNSSGEPRGYVIYGMQRRQTAGAPLGETVLRVHDWCALGPDAYAAVLQYLLNHDLADRIVMLCSGDEALPHAFEEPVHIAQPPGAWFGMCLRLVDVPRALEARPALRQASGGVLTIGLADEKAPWNAGTWSLECGDGRIRVRRATEAPDLQMDVSALASLYNGFVKPADAVRVGGVRAASNEAIAVATSIFSTEYSPYCPDDF